jgi:hypothetical protein
VLQVKLVCCVLCGAPLASRVGGRTTEHRRRDGIHLSLARYIGGFHGYAERLRFHREVCRGCGDGVTELLEPAVRLICDREAGR